MIIDIYVVIIVVIVLLILAAGSFFYSVAGQWELIDLNQAPRDTIKDRMTLAQLGFIVIGRREIYGGHQTFFGFSFLGFIWLHRRDYGKSLFVRQGFAPEIVGQLNGQVMMQFRFRLSGDKLFLKGYATPYKVEFTHKPPVVTGKHPLKSVPRTYRRAELIEVSESVEAAAVSKF